MKKIGIAVLLVMFSSFVFAAGGQDSGGTSMPKSVEVYVPARAGGGTDVMARSLASYINKNSGSNLTIVNNTDGNGVVAMEMVRNAKKDGSVILQFHSTMLIKTATGVYNRSAADDFTVIGVSRGLDKASYTLLVSAASDMNTLQDVINKAKANPGKLLAGVETGGTAHILSGMFARAAGIDLKFVEAGSDTEKLTTLVGGSIDMCLVNPNQAKQYIESGRARALAVVSRDDRGERSAVLPTVPSFIEQGINFSFASIHLFLGPKGMDPALVQQFYEYYVAASNDADVNAILGPAGFQMEFFGREEGIEAIRKQQAEIDVVVADLGLKTK
ncbi:Bug family tripartite tricarboxylate transporter substrate binding protein [Breznakiella homolactica]|uniref:Tripartite tricarboxylate transporter substrate binding protein n=1 Tax=Breznakiella homolactica TaxID=2798577 RepID=A0A7T8BA16_9SPIR|nr:tripartite tricarboxylate transporter substrate binding protein [Breznakiella homolactica]QQO08510.1 tripartite tricarboxylate transporter substrate binding protein [Breznakiella homolactica]